MDATRYRLTAVQTTMSIDLTVTTQADGWSEIPEVEALVRRAAGAVLASKAAESLSSDDLEAAIVLANDDFVQTLNRDYRGKDKPTNVLSFAALDDDDPTLRPEGEPLPLGDVILALETMLTEAGESGKTPADHLSHLVVHGMLHLLGFDHEADEEAETMEAQERAILATLDIDDPYV